MAKKIYDIIPPKVARKVENQIKEFLGEDKKKHHRRAKKEAASVWKWVAATAGALVLILAVYLFFKLPKADIEIWPVVECCRCKLKCPYVTKGKGVNCWYCFR